MDYLDVLVGTVLLLTAEYIIIIIFIKYAILKIERVCALLSPHYYGTFFLLLPYVREEGFELLRICHWGLKRDTAVP